MIGDREGAKARAKGRRRGCGLGLALALVGCPAPQPEAPATVPATTSATTPPEVAATDEVTPEILYSGCAGLDGRVCARVDGEPLRLWIAGASSATLRITVDGRALDVVGTEIDGGARVEIEAGIVGALAARIEGEGWTWGLDLAPPPTREPRLSAISTATRDPGANGQSLRNSVAGLLPTLPPADRAEALALIGDLWFLDENPQAAIESYEIAFASLVDSGALRRASRLALTSTYVELILRSDRSAAAEWIKRHATLLNRYPEAKLRHGYLSALLAERSGDLRSAIAILEEHERMTRAVGDDAQLFESIVEKGILLARLGDRNNADEAFTRAFALVDAVPGQVRARALVNAAWVDLEALAHGSDVADPAPRLREAYALAYARGDRPGADEARINLAYAWLLQGRVDEAAALIEALAPTRPETRRWQNYLRGQCALAQGRPEFAVEVFTQLGKDAEDVADLSLQWYADIGAGEALEAKGLLDAAIARYRHAESLQPAMLTDIAIDGGRERFAGVRDRSTRRLIDLLLRRGLPDVALCAARLARRRAHQGLAWETRRRVLGAAEQRAQETALIDYRNSRAALDAAFEASWGLSRRRGEAERARLRREASQARAFLDQALSLDDATAEPPCDSLPIPADESLRLFYSPLVSGHAAFALTSDGTIDHAVITDLGADAGERAAQLLGPFAAAIDSAERVEIVASGPLSAEAFHALPWRGAPLIATVDVAYSMDLSQETDPRETGKRALILAPPSNLAAAPVEIDAAVAALDGAGWTIARQRGDEADLMARMVASDLLFYVGHASAGASGGWESALVLVGDRRLGVGDLLALPGRAPARVILSGCETGIADPRALAGGMSLASALLLGGAELVIATDARVDDRLAAELTPRVVAAIAAGSDGVHALALAQRALAGAHPEWARFRAIVR